MMDSAILKKYRVSQIERTDDGWIVESESGATYEVTSHAGLDEMGSMYFETRCSCPARGHCRHLDAVDAVTPMDMDEIQVGERG